MGRETPNSEADLMIRPVAVSGQTLSMPTFGDAICHTEAAGELQTESFIPKVPFPALENSQAPAPCVDNPHSCRETGVLHCSN